MYSKAVKIETVHVIPGKRMDIRIQEHTDLYGDKWYKIQYEYSKKNDIWKNYSYLDYSKTSDMYKYDNGFFRNLSKAIRHAKKWHANNN